MKKSYVKPQVYFENVQLSASIAGTCDPKYKVNYSEAECFAPVEGLGNLFANGSCTVPPQPEGACYQGFTDLFFAS